MRIVKKQSAQTYKSKKSGKDAHFYNYYLEFDNGKRIQVKCAFKDDVKLLDLISVYER